MGRKLQIAAVFASIQCLWLIEQKPINCLVLIMLHRCTDFAMCSSERPLVCYGERAMIRNGFNKVLLLLAFAADWHKYLTDFSVNVPFAWKTVSSVWILCLMWVKSPRPFFNSLSVLLLLTFCSISSRFLFFSLISLALGSCQLKQIAVSETTWHWAGVSQAAEHGDW